MTLERILPIISGLFTALQCWCGVKKNGCIQEYHAMRIALNIGYSGKRAQVPIDMIRQAESLGFDSVWVAEAYGSDAVSIAAWILALTTRIKVGTAIMQMPARSPANAAMTAMSLSQLSGNRFLVGLGASGPQVVEGWHGVAYGKPITRLREYISIMRLIMERKGPVEFDGEVYQLPYRGADATGLGKPLKSILEATPGIPIYAASFTPAGLAAAGEVADGVFPIWLVPDKPEMIEDHIAKGLARRSDGKTRAQFDVAPTVNVVIGDDLDACRQPVREMLALYIGGMGARDKNFYNRYTREAGYEAEAVKIQDLYLSGRKEEAVRAVPDALVDQVSITGPIGRVREQAAEWKRMCASGRVGTMILRVHQPEQLPTIAELLLG
jgi:F420-dependent oxidoreductase-like protein